MGTATIRDSHIKLNGVKYFRGKAEDVDIGSYGRKRTPVFGMNYLDVYRNLPARKLDINEAVVVDIDFSNSTKADIEAGFSMAQVIGIQTGNVYEKLSSGELKLVKFEMKISDIEDAVNSNRRAFDYLVDEGDDARIAHQVFVVMEAELASKVAASKTFDVKFSKGVYTITAKGKVGSKTDTVVTLSEDSTFAYLLLKPKWDAKRKRRIEEMTGGRTDQWSMG